MHQSRLILYVWLIGTGVVITSMYQGLSVYTEAENRLDRQRRENEELVSKNAELTDKLMFESSDFAQERRVRNELGLQRPGETVITFVPTQEETDLTSNGMANGDVLGESERTESNNGPFGFIQSLWQQAISRVVEHFERE